MSVKLMCMENKCSNGRRGWKSDDTMEICPFSFFQKFYCKGFSLTTFFNQPQAKYKLIISTFFLNWVKLTPWLHDLIRWLDSVLISKFIEIISCPKMLKILSKSKKEISKNICDVVMISCHIVRFECPHFRSPPIILP